MCVESFIYCICHDRSFTHVSPCPIRRIPRRLPLLLHLPRPAFACRACAGQVQGAASMLAVDAVQGLHQAGAGLLFFVAQVQAQLFGAGRLQVHEHHARFGVFVAGLVDVAHDRAGQFNQVGAIAAGCG